MPIRNLAALPLALGALGLAACSSEPTVSGEEVAEAAEDALEDQLGERPEITCDGDSIAVVEDDEVACLLTDPATGTEYDTTVTFTGVDGGEWSADVQVASEPRGDAPVAPSEAPSDKADDAASEQPADQAELEIPADRLAKAAEDALEDGTGSRPEVDCGGDVVIAIYADRQIYCDLTDPDTGSVYQATITITGIEGQEFQFDVDVADTPK